MAKHGASASTFSDWWAYKFEVLDAIPMNTCLMMDRGVNVSVNSDSGDLIRRLNTEAAKSVQHCGMSQENALNMVTINPAKQLKVDKFTGSLKPGKDADFVIWSGHPLSIYSKVEQTWVDGVNYFDRVKDLQMRQQIAEEKNQLIQKVLAEGNKKKKTKADTKNGAASSKTFSALTQNQSFDQVYLLKEEAQWHCDDNFDFWHWKSSHNGGQH
jgi:adenine deaminase